MRLELGPRQETYAEPDFGPVRDPVVEASLARRLRRPMAAGAAVIGAFVVGLGVWASIVRLETGVTGIGEVRAEIHRQTLRAPRDGGTIRQILVREGQAVRARQPLIVFNDVETRAAFDVYQNQHDLLLAQNARFAAEAAGRSTLQLPADLTARAADSRIAALVRDQEFLFLQRLQVFDSQAAVLGQRVQQLETQISGLEGQVAAIDEQKRLTTEELAGYRELHARGFAPTNLIRRYERTLAEYAGRRSQLISEIARTRQQIGETRLQLATLREERQSQAAEGLQETQARLADVTPRLATARQALEQTVVRAPVSGFVFNLAQFTEGGVVGGGELLMEIVPATAALTVTAMVRPEDVDQVYVGQAARVRLTGLNPRFSDELRGRVVVVSRDRITNEQSGQAFFRIDVAIDPAELRKLEGGVKLTPGMPAQVLVVQGDRSVLGFLASPITDTLRDAFREE